MKKIHQLTNTFLCLFFSLFFSIHFAHAQSSPKEEFEQTISADFCDSFTKAAPRLTKDNMTVEMGMMIIPLLSRYEVQIKNEWGLDMNNQQDFRSIGERIGQVAAIRCPAFLEFLKNNLEEISEQKELASFKTYTGKILKIEGQPFAYLLVQNIQGKTDKIYWMEFFEGADKLAVQTSTYFNKPLIITYKEIEVYQAAEKEYKTIKVVTKIKLKP